MIVLTGWQGFIGRNFIKHLSSDNKLVCVEMKDCWDFLQLFDDWENVDLIIHQGAISSTTEKNIRKIYEYNVDYTLALFEAAMHYQIPIKYASSASIYGSSEDGLFNPLSQYAISKLQIDYWVKDNLDKFPLIQGFRYFNVYGDQEDTKGNQASPISKFTRQIKEHGYLELFEGSGNYFRDFVCVDDVVKIVLENEKGSGIFDLGTSLPISFAQVAHEVHDKFGGEVRVIPFPDELKGQYQEYTCAKPEWGDYRFKTVREYLNG